MRVFFSRRRGSEEIDGLGEPILLREILDKVQLAFFVRGRDQKKKKNDDDDDDDDDDEK